MHIKMLACDLDGTLTDGIFQVSDSGSISKNFNTKDFYALQLAQEVGATVVIITASEDSVIDNKVKSLNEQCKINLHVFKNVQDKFKFVKDEIISKFDVQLEDIAFIGDADNDLEAMKNVGVSGCPADATYSIKDICDFVSSHDGGHGAVYDFVNWLFN